MKTPRAVLFGLACCVAVAAQAPATRESSCCEALPAEHASCCESGPPGVPDLPEAATEKERWLHRIHAEAAADARNQFLSSAYLKPWLRRLEGLGEDSDLAQRFGVRLFLSSALLRVGEIERAIELAEDCERLAAEHPERLGGRMQEVLLQQAAAHFRQAEKRNCIARHTRESCIFPLAGSAVHADRHGAESARAVLDRMLAGGPELRQEGRWLLNVAHMALGTWPDAVPEAFRIPAASFASEAPMPRFWDRASDWGLKRRNHAGSVAIDDFTGDGRPDVLVCSIDTHLPLTLFRNEGGRRFTDVTAGSGLEQQLGGTNLVHADFDGDGMLDVLVLRGGGLVCGAEFPDSLLRQDRPGHFTDVTREAGIEIAGPTRTAAFADVDADGDLDLFIGYEMEHGADGSLRFPSRLFRNDGKGRFSDATARSGIANPFSCAASAFADVDGDGDPDLLLSNPAAGTRLYVNRGDGTFADETAARGLGQPLTCGAFGFFDCDDDGDLDLFVACSSSGGHFLSPTRIVASWYANGRVEGDTQRLFENDGSGCFRDVTKARGLRRPFLANGVAFGDVDQDGSVDLYLATGAHDMMALFPNVLLLGGDRFRDATTAAGVGHLQKGNGVAFADLDDDGDLDLFCQAGGWFQDDAFTNVVFENPGTENHWLAVELRGARENRFGVGARIRVRVTGGGRERDVWRTVGAGGTNGSSPMCAHFGLGRAERILFVEVTWPSSREAQRFDGVPLDRRVRIAQGADLLELR